MNIQASISRVILLLSFCSLLLFSSEPDGFAILISNSYYSNLVANRQISKNKSINAFRSLNATIDKRYFVMSGFTEFSLKDLEKELNKK